ncbi:MAG: secondary thiamine-phosphate synthase enzyme YjbQ [Thermodesulfobacteriota bacterium]|nr:secondary thiamine-phosphate synthase enzyme YjbQ [Thermodesulfobacteriota bacterium]
MEMFSIKTSQRTEMIDITSYVLKAVSESKVTDGICSIFVPHTTSAVTINENADPSVPQDIVMQLNKVIPHNDNYRHAEGNSDAHIKTSLIGSSETIIVEGGRLVLGTWQSLFFCEFDGPRARKFYVKVIKM